MGQSGDAKSVVICRSNAVAPDPRVEKLAYALSNASYRVSVLGWDRSGKGDYVNNDNIYTIHRIALVAKFGSGIRNLPKLLIWQFRLLSWLLTHRKEFLLIHACDLDTVFPALMMKLIFKKKVVYDIFDFYSDHIRVSQKWLRWILKRFEFFAIRCADSAIIVDESRRVQIEGVTPKHLEIVYNSPPDIRGGRLLDSQFKESYDLRIAYVGIMQQDRGLDEMMAILQSHTSWYLDLAGFGAEEQLIRNAAESSSNITWHGRVQYEQALELMASADVIFALYDPRIKNNQFSSPNKLFEAMMLSRPIVVSRGTRMDLLVNFHECGLVVEYGNREEITQAFEALASDKVFCNKLGQNGRRAYDRLYSWAIMEKRLLNLYAEIFDGEHNLGHFRKT